MRGEAQTGVGFPSGHAALSLTLALIVTAALGAAGGAVAVGASVFTGWARMYVGAHLPLDVAGGFAIGVMAGAAALTAVAVFG